jgi:cell division protein FtsN
LAERLKAQRQAAEKLAEKRILAARSAAASTSEPKPQAKPKFTFAEEEIAQAKREAPTAPAPESKREFQPAVAAIKPASSTASKPAPAATSASAAAPTPATQVPPLVPPRPALGGERPIAPQPAEGRPPPGPNFPPRFQAPPSQPAGYRPLDPPNYQRQQPPQPSRQPAAAYGNGGAAYADPRRTPPRGYDPYRQRPATDPADIEESRYGGRPRRTRPQSMRPRPQAYDDDLNDMFEDEAPPRRRASAQDYHQAYRDYDETYEREDRRRSSGPWLIALALFIVAVIATAGWYYLNFMKPGQVTSAQVPVVAAPEKPAKSEPEIAPSSGSTLGTSNSQGSLESAPERRKQIYDRVLGEESIEGNQIVPTQEPPQQVEPAGEQPQKPVQGALPQPDAQGTTGAGTSQSTEPLPLPLPPPPGSSGQQGNLGASSSEETAFSQTGQPSIAQPASASDVIAPVPGETEIATKAADKSQSAPPEKPIQKAEAKQVEEAPKSVESPPVKPKARTAKTETKKKTASTTAATAGIEEIKDAKEPDPMVLVPEGGAQGASATQSAAMPDQITASDAQPEKKSGSFFNFLGSGTKKRLTGKRADQPDFSNANLVNTGPKPITGEPAASPDQVASVAPDQAQPLPMPAPETAVEPKPQATTQGGYLAQLASYRSEAEALAEYDRLRAKYGDVVGGLSPKVTKANVSGTTRYRLGVGPVASREAASRICNSLIAAGERDCLVRGN